MKLDEVGQELIPRGEGPQEPVEGEVLGPAENRTINSAVTQLAEDVIDNWFKTCQRSWARGEKDNPRYEKFGDYLLEQLDRADRHAYHTLEQVKRRLPGLVRGRAADRAHRWSSQREA